MEEWCYDNPDISDFEEVDYRYNEFYLKAKQQAVTYGKNISLIQVQNTSVQPIPFLLSGKDLKEKNIVIEHVEKTQLSIYYEVIIQLNDVSNLPQTLQLNAFWEDEEDWCEVVDSTQYFTKVDQNKIRFRFKHLSQTFNGFFILIDPECKMANFVPNFVPNYASKEADFQTLQKKVLEIVESIKKGSKNQQSKKGARTKQHHYDAPPKIEHKPINIHRTINEDDEDDWQSKLLKVGIYSFVIIVFFFGLFGPGLIRSCKQQKEQELISYGGSRSAAEKSIEEYNKRIEKVNQLTNHVIAEFGSLLIYTNDSSIHNCYVYPNLNYNVFEEVGWGRRLIQRNKDIIEEIDAFTANADSLGYEIRSNIQASTYKIAELHELNVEKEFIVLSFYHYSKKEKEILRNQLEKRQPSSFRFPHKSKAEQLKELDELQVSKVILSDSELKDKHIEGGLKALFAPSLGSIDSSHKFYFGVYNTQISSEEFQDKIYLFADMFLTNKDTTGCFVKKIPLRKFN
jgi:hypothetical protein